MKTDRVVIFNNDDNVYLKWMDNNPSSFVVNTRRDKNSTQFVLHQSQCLHIAVTGGLEKGAYTERNHIKIGSDEINELKNWFEKNNAKFKGEFVECGTCKPFSGKIFDNSIFLFPDTIEDTKAIFFEGAKKQVTVNAYERNSKATQKCLEHYGLTCSVCNINFEKTYGIIGKDFIHVHHLREISDIGETYVIDPVVDMRPVCPNCHSMLHQRRKPCFTIAELKQKIAVTKN